MARTKRAVKTAPHLSTLDNMLLKAATRDRLRSYAIVFILGALAVVIAPWRNQLPDFLDESGGHVFYTDFFVFWMAAQAALEGVASSAYDILAMQERALDVLPTLSQMPPNEQPTFPFVYPPNTFLALIPLGLTDFPWTLLVWVPLTLIIAGIGLWKMLPRPMAMVWSLAYVPATLTWRTGQMSLIGAGLMGLLMHHLFTRPWLAGLWLGLMAYKPMWGAVIPLALLAAGLWQVLAAATVVVLAWAGVTTLVFGFDIWAIWLGNAGVFAGQLAGAEISASGYFTIAGTAMTLGLPAEWARNLLWPSYALPIIAAMVWLWRGVGQGRVNRDGALIALVGATLSVQFYMMAYDLMLMAPALLLLIKRGLDKGFYKHEPTVLVVIFAWVPLAVMLSKTLPFLTMLKFGVAYPVQIGFVSPLLLTWLGWRRALGDAPDAADVTATKPDAPQAQEAA